MVPETSRADPAESVTEEDGSTLLNAFIGAVAGVILSFIPLSTLLGGAVAGYLEGGESGDGLKVGAIAGVFMLIPFVFIGFAMMMFVIGGGMMGGPPFAFSLMMVFMLFLGALYTVGLSAVGGYLGIYLKNEL